MLFQDLIEQEPLVDTQKFCTDLQAFVGELTKLQRENLDLKFQITLLNSELDFAKKIADINSKVYSFN